MDDIIGHLRQVRKAKGLTQAALAQRLGRDQARISAIEKGLVDPKLSTLRDLATALEMEIMMVPRERLDEVQRLLGLDRPAPRPVMDVWEELFIPDPVDDRGDTGNGIP